MKELLNEPKWTGSRFPDRRQTALVGLAVAALCSSFVLAIPAAHAAVPAFPDNIVVFPNRDFVVLEGYQNHVGETATVEVSRTGVGVIGSAQAVVQAGDVAFEINHPGGVCWGAGTGLQVTPDILPADTVSVKFGATAAGDTLVQDLFVTGRAVRSGTTVTVTGHIGATVNRAQVEQRIIEPALVPTTVQRRDVRAVPGPMAPAPKGGYRSSLEFDLAGPNTFTATYIFDQLDAAQLAADAGGERAMGWQAEDLDANRQGLTIAEFGELGGPGMGGCPNGPLASGPPGPTDVAATTSGTAIGLTWKPAVAIPGTPAITGYRAVAVAHTVTNNEQTEIGKRITGQGSTGTTITGLTAGETYDVYVVAVSSVGETFPAVHAIPATDSTAPTVAATPAGGTFDTAQSVTLSANETGSDIYYTADGSDVVLAGGVVSDSATLYTGAIPVATSTTLTFNAFDPVGNVSATVQAVFTISVVNPEPDVVAPTVTARTPLAGASSVSATGDVTVTFSETVTGVSETTFVLANGATTVPAVVSYDAGTRVATLNPSATLLADTTYTATLTGIVDVAGNPITTDTWSFMSAPAPVVQVVAGAPVIGTSVAGNAQVTVNWTAPGAVANAPAVTGYQVRTFIGAATTATGTTTVADVTTRVITALTNGTGYTFDVAAINSVGTGAASARSVVVTPRTEFVLPTVTARTPATGARSVSQTGNLTATFSEPVTGVGTTTFVLRLGTTVIPAVVSYNATTRAATLNPNASLLADRSYTATLSGIRDAAGNTMATSTWSFITGPAPTITAQSPAAGATAVGRLVSPTATFSEAITGFTATSVTVTRPGATIPSTLSFNATTRVLTINPNATLLANTTYTVTITGGTGAVRDLAGNPVVTRTWSYTTGAAN
ncbi:Ig-like domain-containing protein [Cryobacterium aureum]|uniref:Ig-like domain-containing protein n=1 Tax=Cryobacterium aureum TaxID=995037 RepID=UPI000CF4F15A|nr:Ig-like domain-containing protein [Cryobacterium aureum]